MKGFHPCPDALVPLPGKNSSERKPLSDVYEPIILNDPLPGVRPICDTLKENV